MSEREQKLAALLHNLRAAQGRIMITEGVYAGCVQVGPGVYENPAAGCLHFNIPELLELTGLPDTRRNRDWILGTMRELMQDAAPGAVVVRRTDPDQFPGRKDMKNAN